MKRIFLYGPPGSGKSTIGRQLAKKLGVSFSDLDIVIEQKASRPIAQIMADLGESAFREKESAALQDVINGDAHIIALGGGALLRDENRALAEAAGTVICLQAKLETLLARLSVDEERRPLLAGNLEQKLPALLEKRGEHYRSFPLRFDSTRLEPAHIVWQIQITLGRFHISGMGAAYDAIVEPGGLDHLGELLRERDLNGPVAVVTESNVGPLYAERAVQALHKAGYETAIVSVPAGEAAKTLETVQSMWRGFLQA